MRVTSLDKRQAASMDYAGSNPTTFMPMAKAHELARKLQGRLNTTISVI
jgi:hypothetical protein